MADSIAEIADMIRSAERYADDMSDDRVRAVEYYQGTMIDTPSDDGRSKMVSRDVRAQIKKVLPSLTRTLLGRDKLGEFQPLGPGDEEAAEQATDYINHVVVPEARVRRAIEDAIHDALLLRNGILGWAWEERRRAKVSEHSGLPDDAFAELVNGEDIEILEHTARTETVEQMVATPDGQEMPQSVEFTVHDVKIRRIVVDRQIATSAVPREEFIIDPDALTITEAVVVGRKQSVTRSDLVAMGYDREQVEGLAQTADDEEESDTRRDYASDRGDRTHGPNELVDYYDVYVRFDADDDGIAELHHMCFAGGLGEQNLLHDEECDAVQYCDVKVMSQPHQWEGISLADDLMDIQRGKTVLLRQTLDNIYWQNNLQPVVDESAISNFDAVMNPEFGLPIRAKAGRDVRSVIHYNPVPFVARDSFGMMEYLDQEAQDRTGVTDASGGLAPDALQNMTAKASAMIEQQGIGQVELMVTTLAEGLRVFFTGLLRLIVQHQDIPRTVRLQDDWVQFDPRHWNAEMDFSVNVGLGAGTRERDMATMQTMLMLQEKLLAAFGPNNPFVKPENLWASVSRLTEAAGLRTPELYFTEPDPEEVRAQMEAQANQPDPEAAKAQAQMQIEQAKLQAQMQVEQAKVQTTQQIEQIKAEGNRAKEIAQMQADLQVKQAEIEAESRRQVEAREAERQKQEMQIGWEREKFYAELRFRAQEAAAMPVQGA